MLKKYNLQSWSKQRNLNLIPVEKGEGIYFWDTDGKRYTDMSSQLVNMNLGFGNKAIGDAIKAQVDRFCFVSPSYGAEPRALLAEKIISLMPTPGRTRTKTRSRSRACSPGGTRCSPATAATTAPRSARAT
jgi:adenosylmethionine-8-amino-7-oxononanoate aminotransferase